MAQRKKKTVESYKKEVTSFYYFNTSSAEATFVLSTRT